MGAKTHTHTFNHSMKKRGKTKKKKRNNKKERKGNKEHHCEKEKDKETLWEFKQLVFVYILKILVLLFFFLLFSW